METWGWRQCGRKKIKELVPVHLDHRNRKLEYYGSMPSFRLSSEPVALHAKDILVADCSAHSPRLHWIFLSRGRQGAEESRLSAFRRQYFASVLWSSHCALLCPKNLRT